MYVVDFYLACYGVVSVSHFFPSWNYVVGENGLGFCLQYTVRFCLFLVGVLLRLRLSDIAVLDRVFLGRGFAFCLLVFLRVIS